MSASTGSTSQSDCATSRFADGGGEPFEQNTPRRSSGLAHTIVDAGLRSHSRSPDGEIASSISAGADAEVDANVDPLRTQSTNSLAHMQNRRTKLDDSHDIGIIPDLALPKRFVRNGDVR